MKLNSIIRFAGRGCSALALFGMALAADPLLTNTTNFRIPFAVDGAGPAITGSAVLFAGVNGSPMEQVQTVDASSGGFKFTAPSDGSYSFAVRMTDSNGNVIGNEGSLIPELEVVVDTIAPRLTFQLTDIGQGKVNIAWTSNEVAVDPGSLRLEYAEGSDGRWKPITATPGANGQARITAKAGTSIEVRGFITDLAGNQGTGSAQTVLSQISNPAPTVTNTPDVPFSIPGNSQAVGPSPFNSQPNYDTNAFVPAQENSGFSIPPATGMNRSLPVISDSYGSTSPSIPSYENSAPSIPNYGNVAPSTQNYGTATPSIPGYGMSAPPISNYVPPQQMSGFGQPQAPMQVGGFSGYQPSSSGFQNSAQSAGSRQIVNNQIFNIDYQVDDVGSSGVSAVELFVTENGGREWFRYGSDLDLQTPFEVDTRGEGTFGFAVRARNGLGFSQPSPQPGEQPNIVVTVDKSAPMVELGRPQVVMSNGGKIRLAWRVSEPNPSTTPVRLEYSASNSGPWIPLFDWQGDQGGYEMPIQPGMPQSIHFRLLVRDVAGNVAASQTNQPVLVDQRRPTARLLRVQPVSNGRSYGL